MKQATTLILLFTILIFALTSCSKSKANNDSSSDTEIYEKITAKEAMEIMKQQDKDDYVLLDVRTAEEYELGHIAGALLIPHNDLVDRAEIELADKSKTILLYCRSGNRSATAAKLLKDLGYTAIYDFGGIIDWPYDTVISD